MLHSRLLVTLLSLTCLALGAGTASSQEYPTKPIRIITNAAGGGADFISRTIAQGISGPLGQPVIVDNRGGAYNAMAIMGNALPDGYTLLVTGSTVWTGPLFQKANFDMERDYSPVTQVSKDAYIMVVHPSVPANSIRELIALGKAKPGQLNYGASGIGGPQQLGFELFNSMAGVKFVHIPFNGAPLIITALLSNEVQMTLTDPGLALPQIKAGKLRGLAVTSLEPSPLAPGLPTVAAAGVPGYELVGATGMWVPIKTPAPIIARLNREAVRVLNMPDIKERLLNTGATVHTTTPEQFAATIKSEVTKVSKIIKDAGIKVGE